jgi:hypothetical protein
MPVIHTQKARPGAGRTGDSGTRKVRGISGCFRRGTTTAMLTSAKAKRVPLLVAPGDGGTAWERLCGAAP